MTGVVGAMGMRTIVVAKGSRDLGFHRHNWNLKLFGWIMQVYLPA